MNIAFSGFLQNGVAAGKFVSSDIFFIFIEGFYLCVHLRIIKKYCDFSSLLTHSCGLFTKMIHCSAEAMASLPGMRPRSCSTMNLHIADSPYESS